MHIFYRGYDYRGKKDIKGEKKTLKKWHLKMKCVVVGIVKNKMSLEY
jgi:hypothetical protein